MFWRSVVGKLAVTILLLVSFVLFILTVLLLEFFENFHVQEAEKGLMQTATRVSQMVKQHGERDVILETVEQVKDSSSQVFIIFEDHETLISGTESEELASLSEEWLLSQLDRQQVLIDREDLNKKITLENQESDIILVGTPLEDQIGAIYVYQSLDVIDQTKAETTRIIFLAAGIAIVLTTIFAFFLSTRITSPLIKMREAAFDLTRGEFNTKVPILTHDEIGELAIAFNRMGRQLKFHINALRQEKEQLSSIVSSMADGVITLNRNGEMIVINPPAEQFLEDWFFEHNMDESLTMQKLPKELEKLLQRVITGETEVLQEISLQGRNWVLIMTPLHDQSHVRGAVAVIRDMTEERRLDKLRKDFISNVSHELRTPISLMQGYSEAIVDDIAETTEDKNELAQIINEESLRMGRLVNDLLDLGRIEAGHIELNREEVHIASFIDRTLKKFTGMTEKHGIDLEVSTKYDEEMAFFDTDRVEQVLTNLIDNAIHHTKREGTVSVHVENNQTELYVEVADNGLGISEQDLPFIFERFYKADKSRTRNAKKKGTGLGLAIAKNIVEAHRGKISVKSKIGHGTSFTVRLPQSIE